MTTNLILTGFMGTGKTTVGRAVARQLDRPFVDMDVEIATRAGKPIARIFAEEGEGAFRRREAALCAELARRDGLVIATGGGALVDARNRRALARTGVVVCLDATPEAILRRVGADGVRPLLDVPDPRAEVARLLAARRDAYAAIPWHVDTTDRSPAAVVARVLALADVVTLPVPHPGGTYPLHIGAGLLKQAGTALRAAGVPAGGKVAVVSNPVVAPLYATAVEGALAAAGLAPFACTVPDGERHKTLATVRELYDQLLAGGLDRGGTVLALGGGVTGDIAGFAAATFMRGVRFAPVPTSLLAMTDASVGGKTGVDLPQGKNLVGAFKQPALVLIDPDVLATLPEAEIRSGMAEVLKHGVIADAELFAALAAGPQDGLTGALPPGVLARSIRVKIAVVAADPFEGGRRAVLNLGHTVGHALERLSAFEMRHGEAVAVGLVAAARLAARTDRAEPGLADRIAGALAAWGLPTRCPPVEADAIVAAMAHDKKRRGRRLRWVLPRAIGTVEIADDVPPDVVRSVLVDLGARG